jgi:signal transduction histidine kinase
VNPIIDPSVNLVTAYLVENIVAVYFFYGLAFFVLGVVLALASRQQSALPLMRALPLLAWFGLLHGTHEWVEMFQRIAIQNGGRPPGAVEEALRIALLVVSFLCLLGFGVRALDPGTSSPRWRLALFFGPIVVWAAALVGAIYYWRPTPLEGVYFADVLTRYFIAIPGALIGAAALLSQQRALRARDMPLFGRDLVSAATALLLYGVVGQIFVRSTVIPPSNVLNSALFLDWFGVPVQLFRCVMAALILLFMVRALRVFEEEARRHLEEIARSERDTQTQALELERRTAREHEALNQELAARARELALLLDLSNLLGVAMEMPRRLTSVLPRIVQNLPFTDAGLILCVDSHSDAVDIEAQTGFAAPVLVEPDALTAAAPAPSEAGFSNCVALGRRSIEAGRAACRHVDGAVIEFNISAVLLGEECWSYPSPTVALALPLMAQRIPIGAVVFAHTASAPHLLELDELHLMVGVARQLELSMENARLYRQAQEREQTLAQLLAQVVAAQEAERQRIARELHDATGQSLTAIALGLRGLANSVGSAGGDTQADLSRQAESIQLFATDALGELRRIIADLRPPQLDELGLAPALRWYVQSFRKRNPAIELTFTVAGDQTRLPPHYDTVVFRVVQEALTNIAKHSGADRAGVVLEMKPNEVVVTIQDNGMGFDTGRALSRRGQNAAWGLLGIRERTILLNGQYEIKSAPGQGTLIRISVPTTLAAPLSDESAPLPAAVYDDGA